MNCKQVRRRLNEHDLGALPEAWAAQVAAHLEGCEDCRRELEQYRRIAAAVGRSPQGTVASELQPASRPVPDLWPVVRARLKPRRRVVVWAQNAWEPALAVAAAVLIALVVFHGTVLPGIAPASTSFDPATTATADEQLVAMRWQQPMADQAALGMSLALLEAGGEDE